MSEDEQEIFPRPLLKQMLQNNSRKTRLDYQCLILPTGYSISNEVTVLQLAMNLLKGKEDAHGVQFCLLGLTLSTGFGLT